MRTLIVGCGYVGLQLGSELTRQGHEVFGITRSGDTDGRLAQAGIKPITADITQRVQLDAIPLPFDWVINTVSSSKGGVAEYRETYLQGTKNLLEWLGANPPKKYIYTSSTSVYGQTDGSQVKETSPTEPAGDTGKILVETERLLLDSVQNQKFPAIILRASGIYGPDRGHLFQQFIQDEAKIAGKGERLINMIHRDDLVSSIITALKNGRPGEIYNATDDEPIPQIHFFRWLCETLGKNMPPFVPESEMPERKRALTHKKVLNRKLKMELGCQLKYPTFRQGYTAEIKRRDL